MKRLEDSMRTLRLLAEPKGTEKVIGRTKVRVQA
jgi:hypothetical protein